MNLGLESVVAAETVLSRVDGDGGRLVVHGLDVEDLAADPNVEAMAARLWGAFDTTLADLKTVRRHLAAPDVMCSSVFR